MEFGSRQQNFWLSDQHGGLPRLCSRVWIPDSFFDKDTCRFSLFFAKLHNTYEHFWQNCNTWLFLLSFQLSYMSKSMPTGNLLVKKLIEDLDRQMEEIAEHENALMGQVRGAH